MTAVVAVAICNSKTWAGEWTAQARIITMVRVVCFIIHLSLTGGRKIILLIFRSYLVDFNGFQAKQCLDRVDNLLAWRGVVGIFGSKKEVNSGICLKKKQC